MVSARLPGQVMDVSGANWSVPALGRPLCVNGTPWILYLLEECVENVWEYCSVVIGLISMCCFLLSTLPQVFEAYRNGKVEKAISFGFLFFIFSGDLTNFAGCYLTRQLPIQVVAGVFYLFTDLILISQFLYYKIKNSSSRTVCSFRECPRKPCVEVAVLHVVRRCYDPSPVRTQTHRRQQRLFRLAGSDSL